MPEYDHHWLIAQCRQESGPDYDRFARSHADAVGVCQFREPAWMDAQLALGFIGPRTSARLNIKAAGWYMAKKLRTWAGRGRTPGEKLPLAQASFNCGTGCVLEAQRKANDARDFPEIAEFLPKEAREYPWLIRDHYLGFHR